jgi:hypothetical protein
VVGGIHISNKEVEAGLLRSHMKFYLVFELGHLDLEARFWWPICYKKYWDVGCAHFDGDDPAVFFSITQYFGLSC